MPLPKGEALDDDPIRLAFDNAAKGGAGYSLYDRDEIDPDLLFDNAAKGGAGYSSTVPPSASPGRVCCGGAVPTPER